jgi:hypothetical protein
VDDKIVNLIKYSPKILDKIEQLVNIIITTFDKNISYHTDEAKDKISNFVTGAVDEYKRGELEFENILNEFNTLAKDMTNNVSEIKKIHEIAEELFCIVPT